MSYPPDPNNPYVQPQQGAYGYPQQAPTQPAYGYPQYGAGPVPGMPQRMQGQVITARVLLFVAGGIWVLVSLMALIAGFAARSVFADVPGTDGGVALGVALLLFLLFAGMAALHIVPASMFGKGGTGSRVTAIIGASLNGVLALIYVFASLAMMGEGDDDAGGLFFLSLVWASTAILTVVFCSLRQAGEWFNRPRY